VWWVSLGMLQEGAVAQSMHLYNEPAQMVLDWQAINRKDPILEALKARPGRGVIFHPPTLFAEPTMADVRNYAQRYSHQNGLATVAVTPDSNRGYGFALYRVHTDRHFSDGDRTIMEMLIPHFREALSVNYQLSLAPHLRSANAADHGSVAIVGFDGVMHHCGDGFLSLMALEWPQWSGPRLAAPLMQALARKGSNGYVGKWIRLDMAMTNGVLVLHAHPLQHAVRSLSSPVDQLSPRELVAAQLFGQGLSYKEAAREMDVTPATARNFLGRTYQKLGVRNKAELVQLLMQSGDKLRQAPAATESAPSKPRAPTISAAVLKSGMR